MLDERCNRMPGKAPQVQPYTRRNILDPSLRSVERQVDIVMMGVNEYAWKINPNDGGAKVECTRSIK